MELSPTTAVILRVLALAMLVALNGFFVASEFALVKVRETQLTPLARRGHRRAKAAEFIVENLEPFLSAAQLGVTLASLALGWIGEPVFSLLLRPVYGWLEITSAELQHVLSFLIGFSVITFLHITAGEQAPKLMAIQRPLATSLWAAYPLIWFYRLSYPFVVGLNWASQWMLRRAGLEPAGKTERAHSEEELRLLLAGAQQPGGGPALARAILLNTLDLRRRLVREVMGPRQDITALDTEASIAECLDVAEKTRYSRFPLCEGGDLDKTLGVIHIKDLFAMRLKAVSGADLLPVLRKLIYVPETAHLEKLLQLFLERKTHLAIVVDEYGTTVGMITLEDILEELVGQIQDEFDQEHPEAVRGPDGAWEILGTLALHELEELVGETLHEEGINTTSGWVTRRLGGFPKAGDSLGVGAYRLRVEEMDGPRVARLKLTRQADPPAPV